MPTVMNAGSAAGYHAPWVLPFLVTSRTRRVGKHAAIHRTSYRATQRRDNWLRVEWKTGPGLENPIFIFGIGAIVLAGVQLA
jgi:hypothetical protein